jgi:bifunctional ADP-heptose synthase (sugar kinase/adenylyltransferase)
MAALAAVDLVAIFDEPTPLRLIEAILPDVLIKGGDWPVKDIVGAELVLARGGRVESLPLVDGLSTTALAARIRSCLPGGLDK